MQGYAQQAVGQAEVGKKQVGATGPILEVRPQRIDAEVHEAVAQMPKMPKPSAGVGFKADGMRVPLGRKRRQVEKRQDGVGGQSGQRAEETDHQPISF